MIRRYISRMIPECKFKMKLRLIINKWKGKKWPVPLKKLELLGDEGLYLELENGLKFISEVHPLFDVFGSLQQHLAGPHTYEKYHELKRGEVVVDAGATIGTFTVLAAKSVGGEGLVIAIEPEKNNLENLKKNIKINGFNNVTIVPKGLWNRKDKKRFYLADSTVMHSLMQKSDKSGKIEVETLDNILEKLRMSKVDFIKMNIEGAEIQALKGMKRTLRNNDVDLVVVADHLVGGIPTYRIIVPWLKKVGFDAHEEGGFVYAKKSRVRENN